ncbi:LysR family transcriptional regulator [Phenylobacterium sp.]|uniref:LysR family transcriptional regulator n=1 Tax=Phenylobacterium sp. TaxID=1871053 RepID=UPI0025FBE9A6|nr:LysR family transcriptional regulator [Phenylobacterium sp.]
MEMQQVRYFLALARTLNFTRAAEGANVSQPALTRAIQQLEAEFGGPLFHRERLNTHLTELGRMMLPYFESIQAQADAAQRRARDLSKLEEVTLRIGVMSTIGPAATSDLLLRFQRRHPQVELVLAEQRPDRLVMALQDGDLHLAIMGLGEPPDVRFHALPLFEERFVVVVAPDHPWAARAALRLSDLHAADYVHRTHCEQHETYAREAQQRGVSVRRVFSSERDDWAQAMIRAGVGFGIFPERTVERNGVTSIPLIDPELSRTIMLVTVRGRPHSPAVGAFVHEARAFVWP